MPRSLQHAELSHAHHQSHYRHHDNDSNNSKLALPLSTTTSSTSLLEHPISSQPLTHQTSYVSCSGRPPVKAVVTLHQNPQLRSNQTISTRTAVTASSSQCSLFSASRPIGAGSISPDVLTDAAFFTPTSIPSSPSSSRSPSTSHPPIASSRQQKQCNSSHSSSCYGGHTTPSRDCRSSLSSLVLQSPEKKRRCVEPQTNHHHNNKTKTIPIITPPHNHCVAAAQPLGFRTCVSSLWGPREAIVHCVTLCWRRMRALASSSSSRGMGMPQGVVGNEKRLIIQDSQEWQRYLQQYRRNSRGTSAAAFPPLSFLRSDLDTWVGPLLRFQQSSSTATATTTTPSLDEEDCDSTGSPSSAMQRAMESLIHHLFDIASYLDRSVWVLLLVFADALHHPPHPTSGPHHDDPVPQQYRHRPPSNTGNFNEGANLSFRMYEQHELQTFFGLFALAFKQQSDYYIKLELVWKWLPRCIRDPPPPSPPAESATPHSSSMSDPHCKGEVVNTHTYTTEEAAASSTTTSSMMKRMMHPLVPDRLLRKYPQLAQRLSAKLYRGGSDYSAADDRAAATTTTTTESAPHRCNARTGSPSLLAADQPSSLSCLSQGDNHHQRPSCFFSLQDMAAVELYLLRDGLQWSVPVVTAERVEQVLRKYLHPQEVSLLLRAIRCEG